MAKVALVASNEIIADADDSAVYADQSLRHWTMGFPQGYPIWLRVGQFFGVPQRLAVEVLYLAAVVMLSFAIWKYFGPVSAYLTVVLLSFSPTSYYLFDIGFTDGFAMSLSLLGLGFTLRLLASDGKHIYANSLGLGTILGILTITRNEDPLLVLWVLLLVVGCALLWTTRSGRAISIRFWRTPVLTGVIVTSVACSIYFALCTSYYFVDGVFASGLATIPGHSRLLSNLAKIKTGQPQVRYIPISRRARELAYQASPTFAKYRALVENTNDSWQAGSRAVGLPEGEIMGGWIWHAINMKVLDQAKGRPGVAQLEYNKINAELESAFRNGELKHRFVLQPLIGGNMKDLFSAIPASFSAVVEAAFTPEPSKSIRVFVPDLFDRSYVRRASLSPRTSDVFVQGWAFVNKPGRTIKKLVISSDAAEAADVMIGDRADVVQAYLRFNGWKADVIGFMGRVKNKSADSIKITYTLDDGTEVQDHKVSRPQMVKLPVPGAPGLEIEEAFDAVRPADQPQLGWRQNLEAFLYRFAVKKRLHRGGFWIILVAFVFCIYRGLYRNERLWQLYTVFCTLIGLCWLARVLLYTLIDARAWPGAQTRYLAPANAFGIVLFCVAIGAIASLIRRPSKPRPSDPMRGLHQNAVAI